MPGAHGQQIHHAHGFELGTGLLRGIAGQMLEHGVAQRQQALTDGQTHGGGGETLAQRIQLVRGFGVVGAPPALGHHVAVAHHHQTVNLIPAVQRLDGRQKSGG